jgi:hypothetical protein
MTALLLALRVLHVVLGVYWAGTIIFVALFLEPAVRASGPEGGKVMQALLARRHLDVMPVVALVTILSGLWLMWIVSGGFHSDWMGSRMGMVLSLGGAAAVVAFAIGVGVMRPAALRGMALAGQLAQASGQADPAAQAQLTALRTRARSAGRWVAALLLVAVLAMSVARYA